MFGAAAGLEVSCGEALSCDTEDTTGRAYVGSIVEEEEINVGWLGISPCVDVLAGALALGAIYSRFCEGVVAVAA
jgi:hypothetical protein